MILQNLEIYKVSTTKQAITSFAGLPLLLGMARSLGLEKQLNALPLKERKRGYSPAEMTLTLMGLLQAGGVALDDVSLLRGDAGMSELLGDIPAANTLGEYLRRYTWRTVCRLGRIQLETAAKVIRACKMKAVTCAELKMPMAGLFRPGAASPMANLAGLLKRVAKSLPGIALRVRSDSAGYQAGVVRVCRESGSEFTITVRKDPAVMETIRDIPKKEWKKYEGGAWENRNTEIAETLHCFSAAKDLPAYRLIVLRWLKEQPELLDPDPYEYHGVMTSYDDWTAGLVLQFHRTRQDGSENVNKELSGGFGLSKLPCREMLANAAYFQVALLADTVFVAMKQLALPESWRTWTIKTVQFRLIRLAGIVARRSRYLWLKISEGHPLQKVFEEARWRLLGLSMELART